MLTKVLSAAHFGLDTTIVEVEVNVSRKGFPGFSIIGLPSKAVDEARERVKAALTNSGFEFPNAKIIVNLAPADVPKEGSNYDMAIALGILASIGAVELPAEKSFFYGELSLDGTTRHSKGVLLLAIAARKSGIDNVFVPAASAGEARVVRGIKVYPVGSLSELVGHLIGGARINRLKYGNFREEIEEEPQIDFDFSEVMGQAQAKRALEIAASGGHNVFMQGPPGSGKTMLARAMSGILPPLSEEESLEVTKIYSVTGNVAPGESLMRLRPFRSSHHTTSRVGLIGGGSNPLPGEVSLAHRGVLFLDEFPEFSRSTLESLRQPMEDGEVNITRVAGSAKYPCQFMLVAAANPCPCGYLGDHKKECRCGPRAVARYQEKLSGPLMDRIDIHINVPSVDVEKLMPKYKGRKVYSEKSGKIRKRVMRSREIQASRFSEDGIFTNANMRNKHVDKYCRLVPEALGILKQAVNAYGLSARTYFRLIKVSRTIADLEESAEVAPKHVSEALQYRVRVNE